MHRIKKHITLVLLLFLLVNNSCQYFFEPEQYYYSKIESREDFDKAIESIRVHYIKSLNPHILNYPAFFGDDHFVILRNDPPTPSGADPYDDLFSDRKNCPKAVEDFNAGIYDWQINYRIIASINNILRQFNIANESDPEIKMQLAEIIFYRVYLHYRLTLIYGRIPIIINTDVNYNVPRSSYVEVYEFIESEIYNAMPFLPDTKYHDTGFDGIPDRGCAKALLGELYLTWAGYPVKDLSKYFQAAEITKEVIDSASYFNYALLDDFKENWSYKKPDLTEAVFYKYLNPNKVTGRYFADYEEKDFVFKKNSYNSWLTLGQAFYPEIHFYNQFPESYRKDITFYTKVYVDSTDVFYFDPFSNTVSIVVDSPPGINDVNKIDACNRAVYRKFYVDLGPHSKDYENGAYYAAPTIYFIRYAQTLLTYAEASARSGNIDDLSYECINQIRRRANKQPLNSPSSFDIQKGLPPEVFADSVVQERAWELAAENGNRWFDMVRLEIVEEVFSQRDPDDGGSFEYSDNDKYYFPIPQEDTWLNPNLDN